ncbi:MAG: serine/threonine protein kinase [Candidatus Riflebacteria bacterium]|nr:serine/threonine protein kinase [Candidatus Riflebacteria bacterium]
MTLTRVGPYTIVRPLGVGGMGSVHVARHDRLQRDVALKLLHPGIVGDVESERRFVREMRIAAGLQHPNLVRVYDGGVADGLPFMAMELIQGVSLESLAAEYAPLSFVHVLAMGSRVADGLALLHREGILHRDVKPSNVLVTPDGVVKVLDFGLARRVDDSRLTADGCVAGTILYLAPEMVFGMPASPATDTWALGCLLYRLLTGRPHVRDSGECTWEERIVNAPIADPSTVVPGVPPPVSRLVMAMLERAHEQRLAEAASVRDRCHELLAAHGGTTWEDALQPGWMGRCRASDAPETAGQAPGRAHAREATMARERVAGAPAADAATVQARRSPHDPERPGRRAPTPGWSRGRPAGPLAVGAAAVALFGLIVLGLRAPESRPDPARSAPGSAPGPSRPTVPTTATTGGPQVPVDGAIYLRWRGLEPCLPKLLQGGLAAEAAMVELRFKSGLDLGREVCYWVHWFELGRWLDDPTQRTAPPRMTGAAKGPMSFLEERPRGQGPPHGRRQSR